MWVHVSRARGPSREGREVVKPQDEGKKGKEIRKIRENWNSGVTGRYINKLGLLAALEIT